MAVATVVRARPSGPELERQPRAPEQWSNGASAVRGEVDGLVPAPRLATEERRRERQEAELDERLQRRLATYVVPIMGAPLHRPVVAHQEVEPGRWSGRRVALALGLVLVVVALLLGLALLAQFFF